MIFTTTRRYDSAIPNEDVINRLTGNKVHIHDLDFNIVKEEESLSVIPVTDEEGALKTLPITEIDVKKEGGKTQVVITSKMRQIDSGGPILVMAFCAFMLVASLALLYVGREREITYTMLGISAGIFAIFCVRMQRGYYDYVRKINDYVKSNLEPKLG